MNRHRQSSTKRSFDETKKCPLQLVLLGLEGSGKSATGNSILGKVEFEENCGATPVQPDFKTKDNGAIEIVDSPGFSDNIIQNESILDYCEEKFHPHAYLFVIRMTRAFSLLPEVWKLFEQRKMFSKTIVIFTGEDDLRNAQMTTKQYIDELTGNVEVWFNSCEARYVVIDNTGTGLIKAEPVKKLMKIVKKLKSLPQERSREQNPNIPPLSMGSSESCQDHPNQQKPFTKPAKRNSFNRPDEDYPMDDADPPSNRPAHPSYGHHPQPTANPITHQPNQYYHGPPKDRALSDPIASGNFGQSQPKTTRGNHPSYHHHHDHQSHLQATSSFDSASSSSRASNHQSSKHSPLENIQQVPNDPSKPPKKSDALEEPNRMQLLKSIENDDPGVVSLVGKSAAILEKAKN